MGCGKWLLVLLLLLVIIGSIILIVWLCCRNKGKHCTGQKDCGCGSCGKKKKKKDCSPCEDECEEECCLSNVCCKLEELKKKVCMLQSQQKADTQNLVQQVNSVYAKQHDKLADFSLNLGNQPVGTQNNVQMLFAAVTTQGGVITSDSQLGSSSMQPAPYAGEIEALTVQSSATLSAGTQSITVTVNGVPVALSAAYTNASQAIMTVYPVTPISFNVGDLIGATFSSAGAVWTGSPVTLTAQLFAKWTA